MVPRDHPGGGVERLARRSGLPRGSQGLKQLTLKGVDGGGVQGAVGYVDAVAPDPYRVGDLEEVLAPGGQQLAGPVEDDDGGVRLAVDDVDVVLGVGGHRRDDAEVPAVRAAAPAFDRPVGVFTGSERFQDCLPFQFPLRRMGGGTAGIQRRTAEVSGSPGKLVEPRGAVKKWIARGACTA